MKATASPSSTTTTPSRPSAFPPSSPAAPARISPDVELYPLQWVFHPFVARQAELPFLLLGHFPWLEDDLRVV